MMRSGSRLPPLLVSQNRIEMSSETTQNPSTEIIKTTIHCTIGTHPLWRVQLPDHKKRLACYQNTVYFNQSQVTSKDEGQSIRGRTVYRRDSYYLVICIIYESE